MKLRLLSGSFILLGILLALLAGVADAILVSDGMAHVKGMRLYNAKNELVKYIQGYWQFNH